MGGRCLKGASPSAKECCGTWRRCPWRSSDLVVGKSKGYGGWFTVTDRADNGRPVFEVAIAKRKGMLRHLAAMPLAFFGQLKRSRNYLFTMCTRLRSEEHTSEL